jgi:hypothetical protein
MCLLIHLSIEAHKTLHPFFMDVFLSTLVANAQGDDFNPTS